MLVYATAESAQLLSLDVGSFDEEARRNVVTWTLTWTYCIIPERPIHEYLCDALVSVSLEILDGYSLTLHLASLRSLLRKEKE